MKSIVLVLLAVSLPAHALAGRKLSGHYRCASVTVGRRASPCASPSIVFKEDGSYSSSSEKGTYTVKDGRVSLSASQKRGEGRLIGDGKQLVFTSGDKGRKKTLIYLRQ